MTAQLAQAPHDAHEQDRRLVVRVVDGDPHARRMLLTRLAPRVQRVCFALLGAPADADDAAQNALLEILRSADGYGGTGRLEHWADRIAVRCALRSRSKAARHRDHLEPRADPDAVAGPVPEDPEDGLPRRLHEYLAQLPPERRRILVLRHALGFTIDEIAEMEALPRGTIKDRLLQGRKALRRMIAREQRIGAPRKEETDVDA